MIRLSAIAMSIACASSLIAQTCTPTWDYTIGTPGSTTSYAQAMTIFRGDLVVSGAFTDMAGVAGTKYVARYERSTNTWHPLDIGLGEGISNAFGTSFATYKNDLYVGGFFANASGVAETKSIARWDGTAFHAVGSTGWAFDSVNSVWSLLATDEIGGVDRLYIGGGFDNIAGVPAGCVATWDGTTLSPLITSMTLVGINPLVTCMALFDDGQGGGKQLYIGGRFETINGVTVKLVARWNGSVWSAVGTNLATRNATSEVDSMLVYDDGTGPALYCGGSNLRLGTDTTNRSVVKWNGTTWSAVGNVLGGRMWSLKAWNDGNGTKLYGASTLPASGFITRLDSGVWTPYAGGALGGSGFGLLPDGNTMYCAGSFTSVNGTPAGRIVSRVACTPCPCTADFDASGGTPDAGDIDAFFIAWLGGEATADADCSGGTPDAGDIDRFFQEWLAGGC